jgi:hypothetical protein
VSTPLVRSRRSPVTRLVLGGLALLALAAVAPAAHAQLAQRGGYRSAIGINPLGIPFDVASIEFETLLQQGITVGLAGSYVAWNDDDEIQGAERYTSADLKFRYYPGEVVLRGFSVGLSLGVTKYSERIADFRSCQFTPTNPNPCPSGPPTSRQAITTPTLGILVDYNFLLGAQRRFLVGTGVGAKRLLNRGDRAADDPFDPPRAYPFARFSIGLLF